MAPKQAAPAIQRQGMPPVRQTPKPKSQQQTPKPQPSQPPIKQQQAQAQRPSKSTPQTQQQQQQQQPPTAFSTLHTTTTIMLQQVGFVLSGPGRLEERRDHFNTMYSELHSRFQQVADRLEDEISHAKMVVRGQYAVFLETQQKQEQEEKEKAQEEQVKRQRDEIEREAEAKRAAEEEEKAAAAAKVKLEEEEKRKVEETRSTKDEDVIMIDSPPTQAPTVPEASSTSPTVVKTTLQTSNTATPPVQSSAVGKSAFEPPVFPAQEEGTPVNNNVDSTEEQELDFEALFGGPLSATEPNTNAMDESFPNPTADPDPAADDLASLIPGIESYASMDQSAPVTTAEPSSSVAPALDFMDLTMPTADGDGGMADFGGDADDYLSFLNGDDPGDGTDQTANGGDFEDWFNAM